MSNDARPSARRILASVAIIGFVIGGAVAAWSAVGSEEQSTYAGLFQTQAIDLRLDGQHGVNGFLPGENLAPGDRVAGVLALSSSVPLEQGLADLDFGLDLHARGVAGTHRLDEALLVSRLAYGVDDLLSGRDGGRNVSAELDANGDGWISLRELDVGVADLPPPYPSGRGGTALSVELVFQPARHVESSEFKGQVIDVRFIFQLGDSMGPDL